MHQQPLWPPDCQFPMWLNDWNAVLGTSNLYSSTKINELNLGTEGFLGVLTSTPYFSDNISTNLTLFRRFSGVFNVEIGFSQQGQM